MALKLLSILVINFELSPFFLKCLKTAKCVANSVEPWSGAVVLYTVCLGLSVPILQVNVDFCD